MLNDTDNEALRNVLRALYPGETAANANGQAHRFYKDLTYEHTMEMYDRFYRFDNALILLYGDLDWKRFLAFLDKEYLCDAKKSYGKEDGWSFQSGSGRQEMQNRGMSAFYSPEPDGLERGRIILPSGNRSQSCLPGRRIGECGGGIVCDGSERHFMGKADPVQHHCGNDECGWIGFQGKAADGGHPL